MTLSGLAPTASQRGKTPRVEGHDENRQKATEIMDWLLSPVLLTDEEAEGWIDLKAGRLD